MGTRILVAVGGIPVIIIVVLWGGPLIILAALCILAGIAGWELQRCVSGGTSGRGSPALCAFSAAWTALAVAAWYAGASFAALLSLSGTILFFLCAVLQAGAVRFEQIMAAEFSAVALSYAFSSFLRLYAAGFHPAWLLLPFVLSFACDTFAYLVGRTLGKHKLAPYVSPHKTVEGAVGGIIGNMLGGIVFLWILRRFGIYAPGGAEIGYAVIAALSFLCGIVSQIGDLSFSLIKRQYGIKDYGKLFLDHGGVLDRFDSVLFVAPALEMILRACL